ncbi:LuxR C-terminal-related transcriptional regulator [Streptomyces sp. NPDC020802]|uniref:LuxR C-terminal-related transcriptional regulator n=1 Tax=Streptomyces sp. NPDC020802 TaxID=3365094 RepID=UPI0037B557C3
MTSVLVVDDQTLQRLGFTMLIEAQPDMTAVGEAAELNPDVVLMDVRMRGMDGIEATRRIVQSHCGPRVLALATFDLDERAHAALRAGASGFLPKHALPDQLVAGIRAVVAGHAVLSRDLAHKLVDDFTDDLMHTAHQTDRLAALTRREREILTAVATGRTNTEIAKCLHLAESTVKSHVSRLFRKIDARDRVQAVIFAYDTRLVRPA